MNSKPINWYAVPVEFHFLRDKVEKYYPKLVGPYGPEVSSYRDVLSARECREISDIANQREFLTHRARLDEWRRNARSARPSVKDAAWRIGRLVLAVDELSGNEPKGMESPTVLSKLPAEMQYLVEAVRSARISTEIEAIDFLDHCSPDEMRRFSFIANTVLAKGHYSEVNTFLDNYPIDEFEESAWLYFFFLMLDHAGLEFEDNNKS